MLHSVQAGRRVRLSETLPPVPRLGLATRGNTTLEPDDIARALDCGVRYLNWCGRPDGLSEAMRDLGSLRSEVVFATQLKARTADEAEREFDWVLEHTGSDRLEVGTLYYVESEPEWRAITAPGGAWEALDRRRRNGELGLLGLTTHQRRLAARWIAELTPEGHPRLDMLMIRYNAAHDGAETDVFPSTQSLGIPVVTFTALRWRDLLRPTREDPPGSVPPSAADCYRFCLQHPSVAVTLAAPSGRAQLDEALRVLDPAWECTDEWLARMRAHGRRVHRHAREFW